MVTLQKKSPHKITLLIHKKIVFIYCFLLRWSLAGRCKLTFWKFYSVDSKVHLLLCFPKKNRDISPFLQDGSLPPMVIYYWSLFSACCMLYSLVRDCLTSIHIKARKCVFFLLKAYYEKKSPQCYHSLRCTCATAVSTGRLWLLVCVIFLVCDALCGCMHLYECAIAKIDPPSSPSHLDI